MNAVDLQKHTELQLWSINKWLRWTGLRVFVRTNDEGPTMIGLVWYGWGFVGHEPHAGRWHKVDGEWRARW